MEVEARVHSTFVCDADTNLQLPPYKWLHFQVVDFGVGLIKPDWLKDATYLGEEQCGIYQ